MSLFKILKEVVAEALKKHRITEAHNVLLAASALFEISKFYLKVQCLLPMANRSQALLLLFDSR